MPGDDPFLKALYRATDPALQGLPPAWQEQIAEMGFRGQLMTYGEHYPHAVNWILCSGEGTPVGRHLVESRNGVLRAIDLAVLPGWQGQGLGTAALHAVMAVGLPVQLRVVKGNRAVRLYQRLGFHVIAEDDLALELVWTPPPPTESAPASGQTAA